jgi:FGGY-family pentulose kinase
MNNRYFLGIDVGTGSARAGIFDARGKSMSQAVHPITTWRPKTDFVQQSSEDIWQACCIVVKKALVQAGIGPEGIAGIGFDATCSLVVLDSDDQPVSVCPDGSAEQNIIVWMDHRAKPEAARINKTAHEVLKYVGGVISPEMQTPKLLWLKNHMPDTWRKAAVFFDLPDYLVYQATGLDVRSACTTTCKWTYLCHENPASDGSIGRWDDSYFKEIGLEDLSTDNYAKIGKIVRPVGEAVGAGLSKEAALNLGLVPGTPVAVSIIDAHAGGLGLLGMNLNDSKNESDQYASRIALIGGTSSCHMAVSVEPTFIDGVWGPYYSAMLPGLWLNEGGQSATGSLVDHIIFSSAHAAHLKEKADIEETTIYDLLNSCLTQMADEQGVLNAGMLTKSLHVLPYFHGNRSPRADPSLSGGISGLKLSSNLEDLAMLYLSAIQAIAYGTRHIIETMNDKGYSIETIMATGGGTKNEVFLQQHADITGCTLVLPAESEAVLLGSAVLGAVASGVYTSVNQAIGAMNNTGRIIQPGNSEVRSYHDKKYQVFLKMYRDQMSYNEIMGIHI